ncbi:MAG: hypothetical protein WC756_10985 [Taibaiella sp.]
MQDNCYCQSEKTSGTEEGTSNGYANKFKGMDNIVDELADFVKTERLCRDFFDFELKVAGMHHQPG